MAPGQGGNVAAQLHRIGTPNKGPQAKYKVSLFGESAVGKTSVMMRHTKGTYSMKLMPTIGFDFATLPMHVDGVPITLIVWDTAGQERFRTMTLNQYRNAKGLILVYGLDCKDSFRRIKDWLRMIEERGLSPMREVIFIVANKADLPDSQREVSVEEGEMFAKEHFCRHFVTSAKTGEGIADLFKAMATDLKDAFGPHSVAPERSGDTVTSEPAPLIRRLSSFQVRGPGEEGSSKTGPNCCNTA